MRMGLNFENIMKSALFLFFSISIWLVSVQQTSEGLLIFYCLQEKITKLLAKGWLLLPLVTIIDWIKILSSSLLHTFFLCGLTCGWLDFLCFLLHDRSAEESSESKRKRLKPGKVSPSRPVPSHIPRPPYVNSRKPPGIGSKPEIHDEKGIECMRASGKLAAQVLQYAGTLVKVNFQYFCSLLSAYMRFTFICKLSWVFRPLVPWGIKWSWRM